MLEVGNVISAVKRFIRKRNGTSNTSSRLRSAEKIMATTLIWLTSPATETRQRQMSVVLLKRNDKPLITMVKNYRKHPFLVVNLPNGSGN